MAISRREFTRALAACAGAAASTFPAIVGAARARVVVIGGGAGGATAARYLAQDSGGRLDVTLVEPKKRYYTCFFSNWYLGGLREFESLGHDYHRLAAREGLTVIHATALSIDVDRRRVVLDSGDDLSYDRLVLSPGIELLHEAVPGYSEEAARVMPHAWTSGPALVQLRRQVESMRPGGTFLMSVPENPYRCPPGPYERISMIAHLLTRTNPTAKIIVLDAKEKFSKQALFQAGWEARYKDMILWLPPSQSGGLQEVDVGRSTFRTELNDFEVDVASVIPPQRAGRIAHDTGLTDASGWCPIDPHSMRSTMAADVHVLGDAAIANAMPKSAFAANAQAKVAAASIRQQLIGSPAVDARYANTCWSLIAPNDAVKVGASYRGGDTSIESSSSFLSKLTENADTRARTAREAEAWYLGITTEIFG